MNEINAVNKFSAKKRGGAIYLGENLGKEGFGIIRDLPESHK